MRYGDVEEDRAGTRPKPEACAAKPHLVQGVGEGVRGVGGDHERGVPLRCQLGAQTGRAAGLAHAALAAQHEVAPLLACLQSGPHSFVSSYRAPNLPPKIPNWILHPADYNIECSM